MDPEPNLESKTPTDPTPLKKARSMKRVAEIVMVLSGMAEIRAGKEATAVEKALAAEARETLTAICDAELKPKDLVQREAVRVLVEDLGLNKKDPLVGYRSNKLSISEKIAVTKKKMEESRNFTSPTSIFAHSSAHGTPNYHTDRQNIMTYSAGGFQNISPGIHVQTIPSSKQAQVNETGAAGPNSNLSKDTHRHDGHLNGSPSKAQAQVSADKSETSKKTDTKAPESNKPTQATTHAQEHALITNHEDISKRVLKILQPKVFDHPNWNPPSAEYTNQPLQCQVCKININDTESLLVCDACEKGVHLKCLMNFGNKEGIPKAEWHCPRCLIASNGRQFPPKYGRVTRTIPPQKPNAPDKKPENISANKVTQQKQVVATSSSTPTELDVKPEIKKENELSKQTIVALAAPSAKVASSDKDMFSDNSPEHANNKLGSSDVKAEKMTEESESCSVPSTKVGSSGKETSASNSTEQAEKLDDVTSSDVLEKEDETMFGNGLIEEQSDGNYLKSSAQVENNVSTNDSTDMPDNDSDEQLKQND